MREKELQYLYTNPTLKYQSFIIILSSPNITWKHMMVSVEIQKSARFEGCVKIISWISLALLTKQKNAFRVLGNKLFEFHIIPQSPWPSFWKKVKISRNTSISWHLQQFRLPRQTGPPCRAWDTRLAANFGGAKTAEAPRLAHLTDHLGQAGDGPFHEPFGGWGPSNGELLGFFHWGTYCNNPPEKRNLTTDPLTGATRSLRFQWLVFGVYDSSGDLLKFPRVLLHRHDMKTSLWA